MATHRFRPQTAQLQECLCCSFIFLRTVSFSTLTRFLLSSTLRFSQNSLILSLSSVDDVLQILLLLVVVDGCGGVCWALPLALDAGAVVGADGGAVCLPFPFPFPFPPPCAYDAGALAAARALFPPPWPFVAGVAFVLFVAGGYAIGFFPIDTWLGWRGAMLWSSTVRLDLLDLRRSSVFPPARSSSFPFSARRRR